MAKKKGLFGGIHPAVISVWAALTAASYLLPAVALIGTGGTLSVATVLLPLTGVFFGPVAGTLCTVIGSFIGYLIAPSSAWMGTFTFIVPTIDTLIAGLASRGGKTGIGATIAMIAGVGLWFSHEIGRKAWMFGAVVGGYGVLACVVAMFMCPKWLTSKNHIKRFIALFVVSICGMIGAAIWADWFNLILFKTPAITWKVLTPVTPVERTVFSVASAIIGTPLLAGLPKIGIFVGPDDPDLLAEEEAAADAEIE